METADYIERVNTTERGLLDVVRVEARTTPGGTYVPAHYRVAPTRHNCAVLRGDAGTSSCGVNLGAIGCAQVQRHGDVRVEGYLYYFSES